MISRNNLSLGLLALLVLSVGLASADLANVTASISGAGNSSSNPVTGINGSTHTLNLIINHSSTVFGDVNVTWSGGSGFVALPASTIIPVGVSAFPVSITMPTNIVESTRVLTASFYNISNLGQKLGEEVVTVYYNSIAPQVVIIPAGYEFCNWNGSRGFENGSDLEIRSVTDKKIDNKNEFEWRPLDNVQLQVKVKNSGDNDEDYVVEIVFLDSNLNTVDVAADEDDLTNDISMDSGDSETVNFNFTVDGDVDSGSYDMYVKVYQDGDEKLQCVSKDSVKNDIDNIRIKRDSRDVVVKSVSGMNNVRAGSLVTYEVEVANLGREDEDKVKIIAYNGNLDINQVIEIDNLDSGDTEVVTFTIKYPTDAEGAYKLKFSTEYNYDDNDEVYDDESATEDDYILSVGVLAGPTSPTIGADLESDAILGEQLIVKATITNNGASGNFVISATGYESWADLVSITPQTTTLAKGESAEALITLVPKTSGIQSFKINTIVGGETYSQVVSVNIPAKEGGIFGDVSPTMLYLIGGIIVLVVIILLVLIIRLARGPKRKVSDY